MPSMADARRPLRWSLLVCCAVAAVATPARAEVVGSRAVQRALQAATVELVGGGCTGALVESSDMVVTAGHCVTDVGQEVRVKFARGFARSAWVVAIDDRADQALLLLETPVAIEPLQVARRRQVPGAVLYFEGHPARARFRRARLDRIGRCPSLPDLPNALFTSIDGVPGDSGAPLVDAAARIVGLVHGGARCHIATPADTLLRMIDRVLAEESASLARA
jgi:S1-C subfamily serine protease